MLFVNNIQIVSIANYHITHLCRIKSLDISANYSVNFQNFSESTRLWWLPPWNISCMAMNVRKTW